MYRSSLILCALCATLCTSAYADSKRVQVYELTQTFVDVLPGDTLGEIAATLIPYNHTLQQRLMDDIMRMNPDAFPQGEARRLLSGSRLFLPNSLQPAMHGEAAGDFSVETFSWGSIKRQK